MAHFTKRGNVFTVAPQEALDIRKALPAGTYVIDFNPIVGFYLEKVDSFKTTHKIYGDTIKQANRTLSTYLSRSQSTGVLLVGEKGSGKTLLTKIIAEMAEAQHEMPTLIVNQPFIGSGFNQLLQQIEQPCIVLFDEFEKVYDADQQKQILTLFDGVFPTKKLFLLTVNDEWKVDTHMKNRPGRLFYLLEFSGLTESFIFDYCTDNLKDKKHTPALCKAANIFEKFNFDMLKAIVEEMNRYGESPREVFDWLNIRPTLKKLHYTVETFHKGESVTNNLGTIYCNPLSDNFNIRITKKESEKKQRSKLDISDDSLNFQITPDNITKMDAQKGNIEYELKQERFLVILTRPFQGSFNFKDYQF